jgi:hypothetical protein
MLLSHSRAIASKALKLAFTKMALRLIWESIKRLLQLSSAKEEIMLGRRYETDLTLLTPMLRIVSTKEMFHREFQEDTLLQ